MKPLRIRRMLRCLTRRADYLRDIAIPRYAGAQRSSFMREEESALRWAIEQLVDGSPGWRAGIEASIRHVEAMQAKPRDLWKPAYFAALDELLIHLQAMLARGHEESTTELAEQGPCTAVDGTECSCSRCCA